MTKYEFDQMFAEAVVRIGIYPVFRYLEAAARRVGWPIPPEHRHQIITGLPSHTTVRGFSSFPPRIFSPHSQPQPHHTPIPPQNIHRAGRSTLRDGNIGPPKPFISPIKNFPQNFKRPRLESVQALAKQVPVPWDAMGGISS